MRPPQAIILVLLLIAPALLAGIAGAVQLEGCFEPTVALDPPQPLAGQSVRVTIWPCSAYSHSYTITYNGHTLAEGTIPAGTLEHTVNVQLPSDSGTLAIYLDGQLLKSVYVQGDPSSESHPEALDDGGHSFTAAILLLAIAITAIAAVVAGRNA